MSSSGSAPAASSLLKDSPTEDTRRTRQITTLSACLLSVAFLAAFALGVAYHPGPPKPPAPVVTPIPPTIVTSKPARGQGRKAKYGKGRGRADAPLWAGDPAKSQSRKPKLTKPGKNLGKNLGKKRERKWKERPIEKVKEVGARRDCGYPGITEAECVARGGCRWDEGREPAFCAVVLP